MGLRREEDVVGGLRRGSRADHSGCEEGDDAGEDDDDRGRPDSSSSTASVCNYMRGEGLEFEPREEEATELQDCDTYLDQKDVLQWLQLIKRIRLLALDMTCVKNSKRLMIRITYMSCRRLLWARTWNRTEID